MKTRKKIAFKIFQWLITAMVALIILIPIYWIFISSIKPNEDLFTIPIEWIPKHFTLKSYKTLIDQVGIIQPDWLYNADNYTDIDCINNNMCISSICV